MTTKEKDFLSLEDGLLFKRDLKTNERILLIALKLYEERNQEFITVEKLAYTIGITVGTINTLIKSLEDNGHITREKVGRNNVFKLHI